VRSIFLQIFLWFWLTMVLIALGFVVVWNLENDKPPTRQSITADAVAIYAASAAETYETHGAVAANDFLQQLTKQTASRAVLLDENLKPLAGSFSDLDPKLLQSLKVSPETDIEAHDGFIDVAAPARGASGKLYICAVRLPRRSGGLFRGSISQLLSRWGVAILISGLVCYALTRYLTQPILRLRVAARGISTGELSSRVPGRLANRRDELGELVRDFNQMADRIEGLMETQHQLLRDISHELRSPLARLNVALELARTSTGDDAVLALDRIEQESERLNEMIGRLLTLARIKTLVDPPQHSILQLRPLIEQIAKDAAFEARAKNCHVEVLGSDDCTVEGSDELLHSAIENVVRNAIRYAPDGTSVRIELSCLGNISRTTIFDDGPGVPEQELSKIFRPFYRLSNEREHRTGGSGIGLAITHEVARLHGGTVHARNAHPHGLIVELDLPLAGTEKHPASDLPG
jgi:two-component system, OmpR family, sensor histidine kinase CpxA